MTEEEAKKRLAMIAKKQELLGKAVGILQERLFEAVLNQIEKIAEDPAAMNRLFDEFTQNEHAKVLQNFASDIISIGAMNAEYFIEAAANIGTKNYQKIQTIAESQIRSRFGVNGKGQMIKGGFIDSFANDQSIKRQLIQYAYKAKTSGAGLQEFKAGFKDLIIGSPDKSGSLLKYYNTFAYDTYQQVDSALQEHYSKELGLEAFLYLGGLIAGSRPFCNERNGKVFLKKEIDAWKKLEFAGKPDNYTPFLDRGGYNCRHILNAITNKMAVARRDDLEIDEDGKLKLKGTAPRKAKAESKAKAPAEEEVATEGFKPAKTVKEAKAQHVSMMQRTGLNIKKATFSTSLKLDDYNDLGKNLDLLTNEYKVSSAWNTAAEVKFKYKSSSSAYGYIKSAGLGRRLVEINFGDSTDPRTRQKTGLDEFLGKSRVDEKNVKIATQTHEFGHVISISSQSSEHADFWDGLKKLKNEYHTELAALVESNKEEAYKISLGSYASTNANEFMAEAFTEYKLRSKPSKYALLVGELIDTHFKKQKK